MPSMAALLLAPSSSGSILRYVTSLIAGRYVCREGIRKLYETPLSRFLRQCLILLDVIISYLWPTGLAQAWEHHAALHLQSVVGVTHSESIRQMRQLNQWKKRAQRLKSEGSSTKLQSEVVHS